MSAGNSNGTGKRLIGRPFKKGQSGNPNGRPKGAADWGAYLRQFLLEKGPDRRARFRVLAERLLEDDPKTLLAYAYGKPIETHNVTAIMTLAGVPEELTRKVQQRAAFETGATHGNGNGH